VGSNVFVALGALVLGVIGVCLMVFPLGTGDPYGAHE
jgi:hypothetical protein